MGLLCIPNENRIAYIILGMPHAPHTQGALQALQVRLCRCVVCGQENVKQGGNNNVRCWACNCHFCYLCRTWLRNKPGAHFGPGRCKQHSED